MADGHRRANRSFGRCGAGVGTPIMQAMNVVLSLLLGAGAVIGALGMLLLIAGGVAASMMDRL
jgi:hypothetical protein